jgi:hypothetical protein
MRIEAAVATQANLQLACPTVGGSAATWYARLVGHYDRWEFPAVMGCSFSTNGTVPVSLCRVKSVRAGLLLKGRAHGGDEDHLGAGRSRCGGADTAAATLVVRRSAGRGAGDLRLPAPTWGRGIKLKPGAMGSNAAVWVHAIVQAARAASAGVSERWR